LNEEDEDFEKQLDDLDEDGAEQAGKDGVDVDTEIGSTQRVSRRRPDPSWKLDVPLGTDEETERWRSGDMADVYEDALRTLQRQCTGYDGWQG
jgi:kinetochor protein Mis14/NSL1